ncbi:MAG: DUF5103 domain-containing protein [Saprospiraceae bacterium]|nr:DUF5103 domain-containing protein [Saprospiraceae bacterium]
MIKSFLLSLSCLLTPALLPAQMDNQILDPDICAVQLNLAGSPLSMPIVNLNTPNNALVLQFDHMGDQLKDYKYTLIHCDSDWQRSDLSDNEYMYGFTDDRITQVQPSFNTLAQYTHYTLGLPNQNIRWTRSGNYILQMFDTDDDRLVLQRRFMVVEPLWRIDAEFVRASKVDKQDTHHEIDFTVIPKGVRVSMPQNDVKAFVLQNGRWDNALGPLKPFITRGDNLVFDYQDQIIFPAGKEFRFFDIRSFDYRGEFVRSIVEMPTYFEVTLQPDESRYDRPVIFRPDADGRFVIDNNNANQTLLQCDYAAVLFSLKQNQELDDADVYVFGELSDWQLKPEFKMKYDEQSRVYWCEAWLKQGHYNYQYMVVDTRTGKPDPDGFEGNWFATGNQYTILVYFRPFGARFDRLLGAVTLNSARR